MNPKLIVGLFLTLLVACNTIKRAGRIPQGKEPRPRVQTTSTDKPAFIVNARLGRTDWRKIDPWIESITHLRIPGGSASQYTWSSWDHVPQWIKNEPKKRRQQIIVDDKMMDAYLNFIADKNVGNYYVININDDLKNQMDLMDRFIKKGLKIEFIELGNETYLPKFTSNNREALGFVRNITTDDYVKLLETWLPELRKKYDAGLLVVLASRRFDGSGADTRRANWNEGVVAFTEKNKSLVDGYVLHIYQGGARPKKNLDEEEFSTGTYGYMDSFKLPIHITESGQEDTDWTPAGLELYKIFHRDLNRYIMSRNDGSRHGTHVLFDARDYPNHPHAMFNRQGITPVGKKAMEFPFEDK